MEESVVMVVVVVVVVAAAMVVVLRIALNSTPEREINSSTSRWNRNFIQQDRKQKLCRCILNIHDRRNDRGPNSPGREALGMGIKGEKVFWN